MPTTRPAPLDIHAQVDPKEFGAFQQLSLERSKEAVRGTPILDAVGVQKAYGEHRVIPNLNFRVDDLVGKSEIISILGPSGCGKSTILKLIAGLESTTGGELRALGKPVTGPSQERGMIFQKYSSFPFLTVLDNIAYPLIHVKGVPKKEARDRAAHWLEKMYLTGAEKKFPSQLSGGMQQRVAIARTLCMDARIVLLDEPFGALDRKIRWEMQDLMAELAFFQPEKEFTFLLVTHDIPEAAYLGDRVWIINKGELILEQFTPRPSEPARVAQGRRDFLDLVTYFNEKIDQLEIKNH